MQFLSRQTDMVKKRPPPNHPQKSMSLRCIQPMTLNITYMKRPLTYQAGLSHEDPEAYAYLPAQQLLAGTTDFIWPNTSPSSPLPFPNLNVAISFLSSGLNSRCHLFKECLLTTVVCRRHHENKSHPAMLFPVLHFP